MEQKYPQRSNHNSTTGTEEQIAINNSNSKANTGSVHKKFDIIRRDKS